MAGFTTIEDVMASYHERFYAEKARGVDGVIQFVFTGDDGSLATATKLQTLFKPGSEL